MAKTLIPASASGAVSEARTPTTENGIVPATRRQRQPRSQVMPSGTASWRQTTDSSSAVWVIEKRSPAVAQGGIGVSGSNLHTAKVPFTTMSVCCRMAMISLLHQLHDQALNGGGYCTLPVTPFSAAGTSSTAMKDSRPENGESKLAASFGENPKR